MINYVFDHTYYYETYYNCIRMQYIPKQVPVDTVQNLKNMSQRTMQNIRKEGCFIIKILPGDVAQCKAIQDGKIFECPRHLLIHVEQNKERKRQLNMQTSNRHCGCGLPSCDQDSLQIFNSLRGMGIQVPKYKRVENFKNAKRHVHHLQPG